MGLLLDSRFSQTLEHCSCPRMHLDSFFLYSSCSAHSVQIFSPVYPSVCLDIHLLHTSFFFRSLVNGLHIIIFHFVLFILQYNLLSYIIYRLCRSLKLPVFHDFGVYAVLGQFSFHLSPLTGLSKPSS